MIPAGGSAEVVVQLRPGSQESGLKRVGFVIPTDREAEGAIGLTLAATRVSSLQVEFAEDATSLAAGKAGSLKGRVTCRSQGAAGLDAPSSVLILPPATVQFLGPESETPLADGIRQTVREFEVQFPPSREPGTKTADLRLS